MQGKAKLSTMLGPSHLGAHEGEVLVALERKVKQNGLVAGMDITTVGNGIAERHDDAWRSLSRTWIAVIVRSAPRALPCTATD